MNKKEKTLSTVKIIYPQLDTAFRELKKGRKTQKYFILTAQHHEQTEKNEAETLYNIVNVEQLQCWAKIKLKQFLKTLITFQEQRDLSMTVSDSINDLMTKKNDLRDILTEQQDCVAELKISFTAFSIKYQLLKKYQQADYEETQ